MTPKASASDWFDSDDSVPDITSETGLCRGDPSGDPECDEINKRVRVTKFPIRAFGRGQAACRVGMSRYELTQRLRVWLDHATARSRSIERCWTSGDDSHRQQTADAWVHVSNCSTLLR